MTRLLPAAALSVALTLSAGPAFAEGPPCVALVGGTAWLEAGPSSADVVLADGLVKAVGPQAAVPAACERVDVSGKLVTPGFVDPSTHLGLVEIDLESASVDHGRKRDARHRTSFEVVDAYNPRSSLVPIARVAGITSVVVLPSSDGVAGWVDLAGGRQAEAIQSRRVAFVTSFVGRDGTRLEALHSLKTFLMEAREFQKVEGDWSKNESRPFRHPVTELRAARPLLEGKLPLAVRVDRAADIEALLRLRAALGLRLVLIGGAEAWLLADELAEAQVPVLVDPILNGPESFDKLYARADNAALLARAGVPLMLGSFWTHNVRTLRQVVGNAMRAGLDRAAAMDAVTRVPADTFGLPAHGRLAVGARANVVVWSGDPFELSTDVERVFIGGRAIPLVTRQTRLRDRYLADPRGSLLEAPPLPGE